jgi:signal transduction histidine kinase
VRAGTVDRPGPSPAAPPGAPPRAPGRRSPAAVSLRRRSAALAAVIAVLSFGALFGGFLVVDELSTLRPTPAEYDRLEDHLYDAAVDGIPIPRDDRRILDNVTVQFVDEVTGAPIVAMRAADLDVATLQRPEWVAAFVRRDDGTAELAFTLESGRGPAVVTTALVGTPVLVAAAALLMAAAVRRATRPVHRLRSDLAAVADRSSGAEVVAPDGDDEFSTLVREVDLMLRRREATERAHHRFVADASHELRSPVAAIRTTVEVAAAAGRPELHERALRVAAAEAARMEGMSADLVELARAASLPVQHAAVDLERVVRTEAQRPRRVPVDCADVGPATLRGDAPQLGRLVRNLLDNAARHAATGVRVELRRTGDRVVLVVDDDGPGVPPADRSRVLERFVRLADGRRRDPGGAGLGLAVVAAVAEHHGGGVRVEDSPAGGARFRVALRADAGARPRPGAPPASAPVRTRSRHRRVLSRSLRRRSIAAGAAVAVLCAGLFVGGLIGLELLSERSSPPVEEVERSRVELDAAVFEGRDFSRADPDALAIASLVVTDADGGVRLRGRAQELDQDARRSPEWRSALARVRTGEWLLWVEFDSLAPGALLLAAAVGVPLVAVPVFAAFSGLAGLALRPVARLRGGVAAVDATTLRGRLAVPTGDDQLDGLAEDLNALMDRIAAEDEEHRRFVAAASRRLGSPVRRIRDTAAAALADRPGTRTAALAEVAEQNERVQHLVQNLLELARAAAPPVTHPAVDLDDVVLDADRHGRRVPVDCSGVGPARVAGERHQLDVLVANLLDNAARYAATRVSVALHQRGGRVALLVDDDGPGIPPGQRRRVFGRFTTLDDRPGGAGLGLAVVAAVVHRLGGRVDATTSPAGGTRIQVDLPAAPEED